MRKNSGNEIPPINEKKLGEQKSSRDQKSGEQKSGEQKSFLTGWITSVQEQKSWEQNPGNESPSTPPKNWLQHIARPLPPASYLGVAHFFELGLPATCVVIAWHME